MADFVNMTPLLSGQWTDITATFAGRNVGVQNRSHQPLLLFFGANPPDTSVTTPVLIPSCNWPLFPAAIDTKLWAYGEGGSIPHVSETD